MRSLHLPATKILIYTYITDAWVSPPGDRTVLLPSNSLLKKASDPVIAGAARDFSSPKANKKRDSISHHFPE
jgi:hypothetical protein